MSYNANSALGLSLKTFCFAKSLTSFNPLKTVIASISLDVSV
jgi:hypothetical protein